MGHTTDTRTNASPACRGADKCQTNFPIDEYAGIIPYLESVTRDELVLLLRRRSKGFSRGSSKYIGVTKHKCGKWEARISNSNKSVTQPHKPRGGREGEGVQKAEGSSAGGSQQQQDLGARKYTYLGLYDSELEAARIHDKAAVALWGLHAHTNFDVCSYPQGTRTRTRLHTHVSSFSLTHTHTHVFFLFKSSCCTSQGRRRWGCSSSSRESATTSCNACLLCCVFSFCVLFLCLPSCQFCSVFICTGPV